MGILGGMTVQSTPGEPALLRARPGATPDPVGSDGTVSASIEGKPRSKGRPDRRARVRVAAVVPCHNRPKDVALLLKDLSRVRRRGVDLWVVVVDNASTVPLSELGAPEGLRVEHLRMEENLGGSGGFNAGMSRVLRGEGMSGRYDPPDFVWLLDSDVRVSRGSLEALLTVLRASKDVAAAGSALTDPVTRVTYEIGGRLRRFNGYFVPAARGDWDRRDVVECEYLAACSALVKREAIERTGLMPEVFIHGDDVEWFIRMGKETGQRIVAVPRSRAYHPLWSRKFQTWMRYYTTRNSYAPIAARGFGGWTRFHRAVVDTVRAAAQAMMGLPELAELHLQGLEDALHGRLKGHGPRGGIAGIVSRTKVRPFAELAPAVREALSSPGSRGRLYFHPLLHVRSKDFAGMEEQIALLAVRPTDAERRSWAHRSLGQRHRLDLVAGVWRGVWSVVAGWGADVAVVPTGWPTSWFRGRVLFQVTSEGFLVRRISRRRSFADAGRALVRGLGLAVRLGLRRPACNDLPVAPARMATAKGHAGASA